MATVASTTPVSSSAAVGVRGVAHKRKPLRSLQAAWSGMMHRHPHRNLFIVGQPKAGTSWLHRMVADLPGYRPWTPAGIAWNDHTLRPDSLTRLPWGYTATKLHCRPTPEHLALFNGLRRPYVVIHRDLRDVAVSAYFYLHGVAKNPNAEPYRTLDVERGLLRWIEDKLPVRIAWVEGWLNGHDPRWGLVIRYEELLADTLGVFGRVCAHYEVKVSEEVVRRIVERRSFKRATGREPGAAPEGKAFDRKGVAGDWRNHFTPAVKARFKTVAGDALERLGYVAPGTKW